MKKQKLLLAVIGLSVCLVACGDKDPVYETEHPEHARITVATDWSDIGTGVDQPTTYTAVVNGTEHPNIPASKTHTFPDVFPGIYTAYLHNKVAEIPVSGQTATTRTATPPEGTSGAWIEAMPGWLFTGRFEETVEADRDYTFTVKMKQQVRELTLVIEPTGGSSDRIESITGALSGVAGSLNLESDAHASPSSIALSFTKITEGEDAGKWAATVRLLGITGEGQLLTGMITYSAGSPGNMPLDSDLTASLSSFNTDKKTPLSLTGQVVETPSGAGFTATITDWKKSTGSGTAD